MKRLLYVLPVTIITLALACTPTEKKADVPPAPQAPQQEAAPAPTQPAAPAPAQPPTAGQVINNYGSGLGIAIDRAKGAQAKEDINEVLTAVRNYQIENGKYPATLDEIKGSIRPNIDVNIYNYDPNDGTVTIK
jgi:hypothetical protein